MLAKILGFMLLTACVLIVGRTNATPGAGAPSSELTPEPAQYMAAVMNDAKLGQIAPTLTATPPISATVGISGVVYLNPRWIVTQTDRCLGGMNSAWRVINERRVSVLKQALANLIDRMNLADSMQIIAFSTAMTGNAVTSNAWSSDKSALKAAITTLGEYAGDPYRTSGGASNLTTRFC